MKTLRHFLLLLILLLVVNFSFAQGDFDLRFNLHEVDCANMKLYVDIEIKATSNSSTFYLSEQNYRFTFNTDVLANPTIAQELTVSGNAVSNTFYSPHTLTGSKGSVVSYNVELASGEGYHVTDGAWTSIGRLAFDILDIESSVKFQWNDYTSFPPTFVGEVIQFDRHRVNETAYGNLKFNLECKEGEPTVSTDDFEDAFGWELFPNPSVTTELTIKLLSSQFSGPATLFVNDINGRQVVTKDIEINTGENIFAINTAKLASGTYSVQLRYSDRFSTSQQFIKVDK